MDDQYLLIAGQNGEPEVFHTLEGEGKFVGQPSVFLRLFGCNLTCKAFSSEDSPHGCDSYVSWSVKNKLTFDEVFQLFETQKFIYRLQQGAILKITGGEPLLRQKQIISWLRAFVQRYSFLPKIDFETNGTFLPSDELITEFNATFTVSPKLSSNGDPEHKTYVPNVLKWHKDHNSCIKFVVQGPDDVTEIWRKYVTDQTIQFDRSNIWFMPCCGSRKEHLERATAIAEFAKECDVNFSSRLHLLLWDKALRV